MNVVKLSWDWLKQSVHIFFGFLFEIEFDLVLRVFAACDCAAPSIFTKNTNKQTNLISSDVIDPTDSRILDSIGSCSFFCIQQPFCSGNSFVSHIIEAVECGFSDGLLGRDFTCTKMRAIAAHLGKRVYFSIQKHYTMQHRKHSERTIACTHKKPVCIFSAISAIFCASNNFFAFTKLSFGFCLASLLCWNFVHECIKFG